MTIRSASRADIPTIQAIAHATWPVVYQGIISPGQIDHMLELMYSDASLEAQFAKSHHFLLAVEGGAPLGFAGYEFHYNGTTSRLHKLYALPMAHGQGVGKGLLAAVEQAAKNAGDSAIELNVNRFNLAKDFYLKHGFHVVRNEVLHIGEGYVMDDHVMLKKL